MVKVFAFISVLAVGVAAMPAISPAERSPLLEERACSLTPSNPSTYWYENIAHNGISPFIPDGSSWPVYRNVKSYGATGLGSSDDSGAVQDAINAGNSYAGRTSNSLGTTGQPAVVYLPSGTYLFENPIQLYVGTVLMGDPINPPRIIVPSSYSASYIIYGKDPHQGSTVNFYIAIKNIIIDSTAVNADQTLTQLDWSVSQACQLTNVQFVMPYNSGGHTGVAMPEGGSALMINDCYFQGGLVGLNLATQQYHLKGLSFFGCTTGILVSSIFDLTIQNVTFSTTGTGIDMTNNNVGSIVVVDAIATSVGTLVATGGSGTGEGSLVLDHVLVSDVGSTVTAAGNVVLTGSVTGDAWVWGNVYTPGGPSTGAHYEGSWFPSARSSVLTDSAGNFHVVTPPTFQEYDVSQFVNVKSVSGYPVYGDGSHDDTNNLQYIINAYAGCSILFFPQGTYIVTDTLTFPPGSRVVGEVWSAISANGSNFYNPAEPVPMVRVGTSGETGVAQFVDMLFTVADVLQGCTLLEVNMAGNNPGDVGFWNTHFRIGGAAGSLVETNCGGTPAECKATFLVAHLGATSSAYIENSWLWTADHDLDSGYAQHISTGRGLLVEATKGTWLLGMGIEHHTLYLTNFNGAQNVFMGFQQSEAPYWQGSGSSSIAPAPWAPLAYESDPSFSWCGSNNAQCGMALYQYYQNSGNINMYSGGFWTFFNNNQGCSGDCQDNAVYITNTSPLYYFGLNTHLVSTMVVNNGDGLVSDSYNPGGWGGVVAAFLTDD